MSPYSSSGNASIIEYRLSKSCIMASLLRIWKHYTTICGSHKYIIAKFFKKINRKIDPEFGKGSALKQYLSNPHSVQPNPAQRGLNSIPLDPTQPGPRPRSNHAFRALLTCIKCLTMRRIICECFVDCIDNAV